MENKLCLYSCYIYNSVAAFPAGGLTSKIFLDRIQEITILTGIITDD